MSSGVFSTFLPGTKGKKTFFGLGTWNAHGLFCVSDFDKLCRKVKLAAKHARKSTVFCLQETHGTEALLNKHFRRLLLDFWAFWSFGEKNNGGLIILVSKLAAPDRNFVVQEVIFPGRAMKITITNQHGIKFGNQIIYNVHNFALGSDGTRNLCRAIHKDIDDMHPNLLTNSLFLCGDFNISHRERFSYVAPVNNSSDAAITSSTSSLASPGYAQFSRVFACLLEIDAKLPTRYDSASETAKALDRVFTNTPSAI